MKTIIIPTDFSQPATYAAIFGATFGAMIGVDKIVALLLYTVQVDFAQASLA